MQRAYKNVLITGGSGFIGSNFIKYMTMTYPHVNFINIDCLNYCSNASFATFSAPNYYFYQTRVQNTDSVSVILQNHKIDCVVHFAAQTHVDNSFQSSSEFVNDNIIGTFNLLECCKKYGKLDLFVYISTDEVYGSHDCQNAKEETSQIVPTNPYAATKASGEMLAMSYAYSFNLPIIITRCNNVYGPGQYPEKILPKFIHQLFNNQPCTIHGDGHNKRSFIHVYDFCTALDTIISIGYVNNIYNIGSHYELSVLEVAQQLITKIKNTSDFQTWVTFVPDRVFNDTRYFMSCEKLKSLGWKQTVSFEDGLNDLIECIKHELQV
jgi:dTDP-glucose 4,6-dehydratase